MQTQIVKHSQSWINRYLPYLSKPTPSECKATQSLLLINVDGEKELTRRIELVSLREYNDYLN